MAMGRQGWTPYRPAERIVSALTRGSSLEFSGSPASVIMHSEKHKRDRSMNEMK
jgi:hypothetical protein